MSSPLKSERVLLSFKQEILLIALALFFLLDRWQQLPRQRFTRVFLKVRTDPCRMFLIQNSEHNLHHRCFLKVLFIRPFLLRLSVEFRFI